MRSHAFPPHISVAQWLQPPFPPSCFSLAITWPPAPPASAAAARGDIYPLGSRPGAFGRWEQQDGACLGVPEGCGRSDALGTASAPSSPAAFPHPEPVSPGPDPWPERSSQAVFEGTLRRAPHHIGVGLRTDSEERKGKKEVVFLLAFVCVCVCVCVRVCVCLSAARFSAR